LATPLHCDYDYDYDYDYHLLPIDSNSTLQIDPLRLAFFSPIRLDSFPTLSHSISPYLSLSPSSPPTHLQLSLSPPPRLSPSLARQSDPTMIKDIMATVSIPVMAKVRIGHFVEAQILQAIGVDYIDGASLLYHTRAGKLQPSWKN
jgi:hypothetical protein